MDLKSLHFYVMSLFRKTDNEVQTLSTYEGLEINECYESPEYVEAEKMLTHYVEQTYLSILMMLESMKMGDALNRLKMDFKTYRDLASFGFDTDYDSYISEPSEYLWKFYLPLSKLFEENISCEKQIVERIIEALPRYLQTLGFEPKNEVNVTNQLLPILEMAFPSSSKSIVIPHTFKNFKPDIGISELKLAIECKFVDDKKEVGTAIGGLFEDFYGYSGTEDWKTFYSVIYQTGPYITKTQLDYEFKEVKNWKPLLLTGQGARVKKQTESKQSK